MNRVAICAVPFALAACSATPSSVPGYAEQHHHLRFQNGYVRVMETRLEPQEETLAHSHPIDAAVVFLDSGRLRIRYDDGTTSEAMVEADTVEFGASPIVHRTANAGDETVRVVVTEIFTQPPAAGRPQSPPRVGEVLLENDTVCVSRVTIGPSDSAALTGVPPLVVVAMSRGAVVSDGKTSTLSRGDVRWCDTGSLELRSSGTTLFETVLVMLKPRVTPGG